MSNAIFVDVNALPSSLREALAAVGYKKRNIGVSAEAQVTLNDYSGAGLRAFAVIVNLATGERAISHGSWGGSNLHNPTNAVDNDRTPYAIPPNGAVIRGREGGDAPVAASIAVHPAALAPLLPASAGATARQQSLLAIYSGIKAGSYRQEYLSRASATKGEIEELIQLGWLKRNAAGSISITTAGKNAQGNARAS